MVKKCKSTNTAAVLADLPERYSVSVPPVTNNIYRSAAPTQNYLPERRSAALRHHYSPAWGHDIGIEDPRGHSFKSLAFALFS